MITLSENLALIGTGLGAGILGGALAGLTARGVLKNQNKSDEYIGKNNSIDLNNPIQVSQKGRRIETALSFIPGIGLVPLATSFVDRLKNKNKLTKTLIDRTT